jgi:hypothetical protein
MPPMVSVWSPDSARRHGPRGRPGARGQLGQVADDRLAVALARRAAALLADALAVALDLGDDQQIRVR